MLGITCLSGGGGRGEICFDELEKNDKFKLWRKIVKKTLNKVVQTPHKLAILLTMQIYLQKEGWRK